MAFRPKRDHQEAARPGGGKPVVGCGAGTGISAKCAEAGGADLIIIYNSGRYRMAGRGSLAGLMPYGDANGIVVEMASEPGEEHAGAGRRLRHGPVPADARLPEAAQGDRVLRRPELPHGGAHRRQFPGQPGGGGMGYDKEVDMIAEATSWTCSPRPTYLTPSRQWRWRRRAPTCWWLQVDHRRSIGTAGVALTLDEAIERVMPIAAAGRRVHDDIMVICHGGPFDEPEAVGSALAPGDRRFLGADQHRTPAERAITGQVKGAGAGVIHLPGRRSNFHGRRPAAPLICFALDDLLLRRGRATLLLVSQVSRGEVRSHLRYNQQLRFSWTGVRG